MNIKYINNNISFSGYKSSKYMETSYTTNSLLDSRTGSDNIPKNIDTQDSKTIWGYSTNRLKGLYNYYGFSSSDIDPKDKARIQSSIDTIISRLSASGLDASNLDMLVRLVEDKKLSINLMVDPKKNYEVSSNVSADLDKLYEAYVEQKDVQDVFVPKFEDAQSASTEIKIGDVCQLQGNKNISIKMRDGSIKELFISPETYLELFPPVERFISSQAEVGDCYLLSTTNSINQNPFTRYKILEMFRQNPDDTVDIVFGGFENQNGNIVPKNPKGLILEDIGAKLPEHVSNYALSLTCEGIRAIELLSEFENQTYHSDFTQEMYNNFKQNGLKSVYCRRRPYTQEEIQYFISYADKHGINSFFCLQNVGAEKRLSITKEEAEQKIQELQSNTDDDSKYKVAILQRMINTMDKTGAASLTIFGDTIPKKFLLELFKNASITDLYYNNAGHSSAVYKQFGLEVIHNRASVEEAKKELLTSEPSQYVYTCNTIKEKADLSDGKFMARHTYSLEPVDIKGERKFAIKDPHNTMEEIILSYDELCKYINTITIAKI